MWSCWHEYSRNEQNTAQHFNSESCAPSLCSTAEMKPPLPQNQESAVFLPNGARCLTYAYSFVLFSNVKQYKQFLTSCYSFDNSMQVVRSVSDVLVVQFAVRYGYVHMDGEIRLLFSYRLKDNSSNFTVLATITIGYDNIVLTEVIVEIWKWEHGTPQ